MPKLNKRHLILVFVVLVGLTVGIVSNWPDGKVHIVFCDVGQGDAIYIRFPNGGDMLVDGGPKKQVLTCLGKYMPFYDRTIDIVALTHPQQDHFGGLTDVLQRYTIEHFVTVPVKHTTESYEKMVQTLFNEKTDLRYLAQDDQIHVGEIKLRVVWPDRDWIEKELKLAPDIFQTEDQAYFNGHVLGATTQADLNIFSPYLHLSFKNFDLLLTGDGDQGLQTILESSGEFSLLPADVEVLKVPHHGSRTGMTQSFLDRVSPDISIIQSGKNSYGHPNQETIERLQKHGKVLRNDQEGDIEIVSDGEGWEVQ